MEKDTKDKSLEEVSKKGMEKYQKINTIKDINSINDIKNTNIKYTKIINNININSKNELYIKKSYKLKNQLFGFENIGNSCYMNSFLQILFHTPHFLDILKKSSEAITNNLFIDSLIKLSENHNKIYLLKTIKQLMAEEDESFGMNVQNDSQEFGINLINKIISNIKGKIRFSDDYCDDCDKKINIKDNIYKRTKFNEYENKYCKNETPLDKMFVFHEILFIMKKDEKDKWFYNNINFNSFLNIDLPFDFKSTKSSYNLTELLKNYYPKNPNQNSQNDDKGTLEWLKDLILNFIKRIFKIDDVQNVDIRELFYSNLVTLPNILIISINRVMHGSSFYNKFFSNRLIFEEKLDLKDYLENDFMVGDTNYELYGINECYKKIFFSGHYYSYVKINNQWYKFDDLSVEPVIKPNMDSKYVVGLYYVKKSFINDK